jgi:amyloid beta precursor protein binding protein 1
MATDDKYDRQLRLWGPSGQRALMHSHILLIKADATGTETLKNLVLPGVGHFTVLDDKMVTEEDLGVNFFVEELSIGRPR